MITLCVDLIVMYMVYLTIQKWSQRAGWTKYDPKTGKATAVKYPEEDVFVFDVEILVMEGHYPTMATALSPTNWFVIICIDKNQPLNCFSKDISIDLFS